MAAPVLSLSTLGSLRITWDSKPVAGLGGGKLAALLVYLALEPGRHRRETLAELFWPGMPAESARLNLRQAVFQLRNALAESTGHPFLLSDRDHLGFNADSPHRVDAIEFISQQAGCGGEAPLPCDACLARMSESVGFYRGAFLADFTLPDCPDFEDWLRFRRESLHRSVLELLAKLSDYHEQQGNYRAALPVARRYTELEPWNETGYMRTMRLYARDGQRDAALGQYDACRRILKNELGVFPHAEMQALMERVRRGEFAPADQAAISVLQPSEERRMVTVLYCELNVPTAEDPEDAMALLRAPQLRCEEIVRGRFGHIVQVHGGGLLAYFGYPQALENAALSAVRTAQEMVAAGMPGLEMRVCVHSGPIVTASNARIPDPIGMTSDAAIRLRQHADSGDVVVSEETQRRVIGYFQFARIDEGGRQQPPQALKVFKVVGASGAVHRLAAAAKLTPFFGRQDELARMTKALARAQRGQFQALLVSGEAGIGKSRLVSMLKNRFNDGSAVGIVRELRGFPETMQSPLHPVIALYESLCGFEAADTPLVKLAKLRDLLETRAPALVGQGLPLLARMLGLTGESAPALPELTPEKLRAATHALLIDMLYIMAARQPVLIVVEDLHWIDISTLELLSMLVANSRPARVFLLMTARPASTPDWPGNWPGNWQGIEIMPVAPLPDAAIADMVDALYADMPPERQARIVARADGIPLFAEELAAMAQERELPANLHDLLMVRLDSLGPARTIAQLAATVGREFDLDFLGRIVDLSLSPASLQQAIGQLQDSGLVQQLADERLQFKHALVQEAAYQSQTRAARQTTHRRIAQLLETGYREVAAHQPELLAQHWSAAGEASKAIHYWVAAGRHAAAQFAHREAVSHYDAALELLVKLTDDTERSRLEVVLLVDLGKSEYKVAGHGQRRSGALLVRAVALLERGAGDRVDLFNALWGLWESSGSQAGYEETVRLGRRLLDIAEKEGSRALLQQGHYAMGNGFFWTGQLAAARRHLEQSIALEDKNAQSPTRDSYGRLVMVNAKAFMSWVLWLQGLSDQALAQSEAAVALARRFDNRNNLAYALTFAAVLQRWLGNTDESLRLAEEGHAVAVSCQSVIFAPVNLIGIGWASVMRGDASAIASIAQGVDAIRAVMNGAAASMLAPFAEALLHLGETEKALAVANEALQLIEEKHDRYYLAELHRIKGMCLLKQQNKTAALACFETAIAVSQAQGAVAFELRARECLAMH